MLVHDPLPGVSTHAVVEVESQEAGAATAGRMFQLLAGPDVGCASVTQFLGRIPVVRAPDHFHTYDEVVYVLHGQGALHIGGESVAVQAGTAIHFPSGLVHCLENTGPGEMQILGVFRPAGSPAKAYYPERNAGAVLMPRIERSAKVVWEGNVARGGGSITADTGAFSELEFSLATRIGQAEGKTSPEELLAAAHGGCLTMSLASELSTAETPPRRLDVACRIVMDEVEGRGHQIVASKFTISAAVDGASEDDLAAAIGRADEGCAFSQLLKRAGREVSVSRA